MHYMLDAVLELWNVGTVEPKLLCEHLCAMCCQTVCYCLWISVNLCQMEPGTLCNV
jgi:hypothetical protein